MLSKVIEMRVVAGFLRGRSIVTVKVKIQDRRLIRLKNQFLISLVNFLLQELL